VAPPRHQHATSHDADIFSCCDINTITTA
jgi:hypothetical protein